MATLVGAAALGAAVTAAAGPYLASITIAAADRSEPSWWRGAWPLHALPSRRVAVTSGIGALCGLLAGLAAGWTTVWPAFLWLALTVTPLIITDIEHKRLPDAVLAVGAAGAAVLLTIAALIDGDGPALVRAAAAAAIVFVVFLMLTLAGGLKFGDTKLETLLACYLGWLGWKDVLLGLAAGFTIAAVARIPLLIARRTTMREDFAFGPYLIAGALLAGLLSL